jgi:hypothetical protein
MTCPSSILQAAAVLGLGLATGLPAQTFTDSSGSSSVTYFTESRSDSDGGTATSATYALTATIGQADPSNASSATYLLAGGFPGTLDATSTEPWLTAAQPQFVMPRSTDLVWLSGARLDLGTPTVDLSGRAATLVAQSGSDVAVRLPSLPAPGFHEIALHNAAGTTSLERGIGVLPMLFTEGAAASDTSFDLVFKGTKGDMIIWAVSRGPGQLFGFSPYLHGLTIDLTVFRVLDSLLITKDSGELRFSVPPVPFQFPAYFQALFLTSNPGYAPGSFSNVLSFQ